MAVVTIHQVAKEAGLSTASVSRILRGGAGYTYPPDTEARVRAVAERLGYQANAAARMLRSQPTKTIGLGAAVTIRPHINHMVLAVHDELKRRGYEPILFEPMQLVPSRSHAPFPSLELLAGMICVDISLEEQFPDLCETVYGQVPVVALYPTRSMHASSVFTDLQKGTEIAVEHLFELGHRRLALSTTTGGRHPSSTLKRQGWQRTLRKFNFDPDSTHNITLDYTYTLAQMGETIARDLMEMSPRPTALACHNDEVALYVVKHLSQAGWRIPEDLSVVGFDGIEWGEYANPPLTTIAQPFQQLAEVAVECLIEHTNRREENKGNGSSKDWFAPPLKKLIEPSLLVRGSTAAPR